MDEMVKTQAQESAPASDCDIALYQDIATEVGLLDAVYLGPCGVIACASDCADPQQMQQTLREVLQITRVDLYVFGKGLYNPRLDVYDVFPAIDTDAPAANELPMPFILNRIGPDAFRQTYSAKEQEAIGSRLLRADAMQRGWYEAEDGRRYLRFGNIFREASDKDSVLLFYAALFGGALGTHRFMLGKFWTGLLYLCTGGLCLLGWSTDLLFLLLGIMRDKKKRILWPLNNRLRKMLLIPFGFVATALVAALQITLMLSVLSTLSQTFTESAQANSNFLFNLFQSFQNTAH